MIVTVILSVLITMILASGHWRWIGGEVYGGVTTSCREMASDETGFFGALCRAIDLPATAAFDTVLLPISIPVQLTRGNGEEEATPSP